MRNVAGSIVLAVAVAACAGTAPAPEAVTAGEDAQQEAASYARETAKEVYKALRRGKLDTSQSLLGDEVFAVGPRAKDVYSERTAAVLAATAELDAGERHKLSSRGLVTGGSVTGKSAWMVDRIDIDRRRYSVVAVLAEIDEIWYIVALHVGATGDGESTGAAMAPLGGGVSSAAADVVELVRAGAASPDALLEQLSGHPKVTVVGPGRSDHLRGARKITRKWKRKRGGAEPFALSGDVRAAVTPDGGLAWVVANTRAGDGAGLRTMFVYERVDDGWHLVALQRAVPLP